MGPWEEGRMATRSNNNRGADSIPARGAVAQVETIPPGTGQRARRAERAARVADGGGESEAAPQVQARRAERRPEMVKQRRVERRQAFEKQRRQSLLLRIGLAVVALLVIGGVGWGVYRHFQEQSGAAGLADVKNYSYAGGDHSTAPVQYKEVPPVGGVHDPTWQNCGFYSQPIRSENAVHSLEHGAVWITYQPTLPQAQIDLLRKRAEQSYILVSPFPGLPAPVVASSWNHQVQLTGATDARLDPFIRAFKEGPDTPEPRAACTGGVGTPS